MKITSSTLIASSLVHGDEGCCVHFWLRSTFYADFVLTSSLPLEVASCNVNRAKRYSTVHVNIPIFQIQLDQSSS